MEINDFVNGGLVCDCGEVHCVDTKSAVVSSGAVNSLRDAVNGRETLVISDRTCAGLFLSAVNGALGKEGGLVLADALSVSETAAAAASHVHAADTVIIALGGGRVCDAAKLTAFKTNRELIVLPTSPSTDGFASNRISVTENGLQRFENAVMPRHIIMDTDFISSAPKKLFAAGYGTLLARYVELADRRLANIIDGEPMCAAVHDAQMKAMNLCMDKIGDKDELIYLCNALAVSGFGESYAAKDCRGSAHNVLRYLVMRGDIDGFNGIGAGMAAHFVYRIYPYVYAALKVRMRVQPEFSLKKWRSKIKRKFDVHANSVIEMQERSGKYGEGKIAKRIDKIYSCGARLIESMNVTPDLQKGFCRFQELGGTLRYEDADVSRMEMRDAMIYGKDLSVNYGALDLLQDVHRLKEAVEDAVDI